MLKVGDKVVPGDGYWNGREWRTRHHEGVINSEWYPTRRRIDPGEGWEIIPANEHGSVVEAEYTHDGVKWHGGATEKTLKPVGDYLDIDLLAARRRKQPSSEWLDIRVVVPGIGQRIWINHVELGVLLNKFSGEKAKMWTLWRPVKPGEIPEPPKPAVKSQEEIEAIIRNPHTVWYGPHECDRCGGVIVKSSFGQGGVSLNAPHDHHYPNHKWTEHVCGRKS
jgi:hypothetical protein